MSKHLPPQFRTSNDPRRYVPMVWWAGDSWTMSVYGPDGNHHMRDSHSRSEIAGYAKTWALINRAAGFISFRTEHDAPATTHELAA